MASAPFWAPPFWAPLFGGPEVGLGGLPVVDVAGHHQLRGIPGDVDDPPRTRREHVLPWGGEV